MKGYRVSKFSRYSITSSKAHLGFVLRKIMSGTFMQKVTRRVLGGLAAISFVAAPVGAQADSFPYNSFPPRTLSEIYSKRLSDQAHTSSIPMPKNWKPAPGDPVFNVDYRLRKARVRARYVGQVRAISAVKRNFIEEVLNSRSDLKEPPDTWRKMWQREYLFEELGKRYWVPVAQQIEPYLIKELALGANTDLYILQAGDYTVYQVTEVVVLAEDFQAR
jgi:hypothetical protein